MIRAVANKPLDLTDDEFQYYLQIIEAYGPNIFQETFISDEEPNSPQHGLITMVTPPFSGTLPMGVVFFLFNVMLNQRARQVDRSIVSLNDLIKKAEDLNGK